MNRKYQIFISSTYTDLIDERKYVQDVILAMNHFPVGMELFSAASEEQWDIIKRTIDTSDFYVLIIGYRYGSESPDGTGYTEREFLYAKEKGIPIIVFIKQEGLPVREADREASASKRKKLKEFINRAKLGREVSWWSTKEELGQKITISLYKEFQRVKRPSWIRATEHPAEQEIKEIHKLIGQLQHENNQNLSESILKALQQVLQRLQRIEAGMEVQGQDLLPYPEAGPDGEDEIEREERELIATAKELGIQFRQDSRFHSDGLMCCKGCHVMLVVREGTASELDAAMACLLNEKVYRLSRSFGEKHCLRMRQVFFDRHATHSFLVDYLYDASVLPLYTEKELSRLLETEFCGQVFAPEIRYIEENFGDDQFDADDSRYYTDRTFRMDIPVCRRDGFYVADISDVFVNEKRGDSFYKLDGLLPFSVLGEETVPGESHWLADWGHEKARCRRGDTVKFKIKRVYELKNWRHTSNARNIDFSELEADGSATIKACQHTG